MFVCICKAKREKDILASIDNGANTVSKVTEDCQAGGDCGSCRYRIDELIKEQNSNLTGTTDPES